MVLKTVSVLTKGSTEFDILSAILYQLFMSTSTAVYSTFPFLYIISLAYERIFNYRRRGFGAAYR